MGISYQTSNRQRRKVMTAPLGMPPIAAEGPRADRPEPTAPAPEAARSWLSRWLSRFGR